MIVSKEAREYRKYISRIVLTTVPRGAHFDGKLQVSINCYPPDKRKRDLDNLLKVLLDAMAKSGLYKDDSQIDKIIIERMNVDKAGKGFLVIEIKELSNEI